MASFLQQTLKKKNNGSKGGGTKSDWLLTANIIIVIKLF